ncbi:SPOSA6832_04864 [Sporobolomyces salmonicolor]|uniref:SPOSA6832_04864-mRNA-1:cds n=1 Tax=Sporidiobolus salmonicolor TaxID=5005 RepID=A0A0D6ETR1_SPOSA|nr:SPOSA6832_04864 [Sporobolomyces salmonicolor]
MSSSSSPPQQISLTAVGCVRFLDELEREPRSARKLTQGRPGFVSGALAACTAVTITNPMEVTKTRLQLDGELQGRKHIPAAAAAGAGPAAAVPEVRASLKAGPDGKVYTSAVDCMQKTWKNEGLKGIQRGLGAAYTYQIALNGSRLGFYEPMRRVINSLAGNDKNEVKAWSSIAAGASSGVVGAILGNPLFLIKARMQAYSPFNPVGAQHNYPTVFHGFKSIVAAEGPKGLVRGMDAAILRTAMGSSVQLPSYNLAKTTLMGWGIGDHIGLYLLASTFSGMCVCAVMQPAGKSLLLPLSAWLSDPLTDMLGHTDTALTRMYNQSPNSIGPDGKPRGLLCASFLSNPPLPFLPPSLSVPYDVVDKNPIDCLYKTWRTEGFLGWYKGTTAHLMRIAPHTVVTLVTNEFLSRKFLAWKAAKATAGKD